MRLPQRFSLTGLHASIRLLIADYFLGLAAFTVLRIAFLVFNHSAASVVPTSWLALSLLRGIQFDSVACGMILLLPWLFMFFGMLFTKHESKFRKAAFIATNIFFMVAFFAAFADMPLFMQFGKRLSVAALSWSNSPVFILKIIFGNVIHLLLIVLFSCSCFLFYRLRKRISKRIGSSSSRQFSKQRIILTAIICGALILLAVRGRVSFKSPVRWGTAYFCTNTFANQTVLNPFYTFVTSTYESFISGKKDYHVMDDKAAAEILRNNISKINDSLSFRNEVFGDFPNPNRNVVIVIMESMAGWKTGLYPDGLHWTNCLDSLSKEGIFFSQFYSDGIHTFNGLYSTLTGNQALPKTQPLGDINVDFNPTSIAELLKAKGYSTTFFMTHDAEFDNMNGFMRGNGYDEVISEPDYKTSAGMNPMGIPDHLMFEFARQKINGMALKGKPFFVSFMTGSDHEPFEIPENISFVPNGNNAHENAARYADWSIGQFMDACKKESWYANTVFVFVADHGGISPVDGSDMYLAFHHIPCIILGPGISPQVNHSLATQADILPTLMGLLKFNSENPSMGIDLFAQKRNRLFFTYDEETCSLDSNSFYVQRAVDTHLFMLNENESNCVRSEDAQKIKAHQEFIAATLQLMEERFYSPGKSK